MPDSPTTSNARQERRFFTPPSDYIQPNLGHALRVWWAFYWRTSLISTILAIAAGYGLNQLYENTALSAFWIGWAMKLIPYVLFYGVAVFVMRFILHKKFRHFRIGLSPRAALGSSQVLEATFRRTLPVWWTYCWRAVIYSLVAWVVISYPMGLSLGLFAPSPTVMALCATGLGFVISAGVGLYVIYSSILDEDIADFHVCLWPREAITETPAPTAIVPEAAAQ